jgi:hypothetical protein
MNEYTFCRVAVERVTVKAMSEREALDKLYDGEIDSQWFEEAEGAQFEIEGILAPGGA